MPFLSTSPLQIVGIILGTAAIAYLLLAIRAVFALGERSESVSDYRPPVSLLKPVHGAGEGLYESLRSFCDQDWPKYEVLFGVHSANDAAVPIVEKLIADFPDHDIRLVVDAHLAGPNRKAANLANIFKAAKYEIGILSDDDVRVGRDCISSLVVNFKDPKVGVVTSIYKGRPIDSTAARFGALYINDWFVPSVCADVWLRGIDFTFGAMAAFRREALQAIGGFERLAKHCAEDFSLGRLISNAGLKVALSRYACDTLVTEKTLAELFGHEVRWQRLERACRPLDHFLSIVTWPLPLMMVLLLPRPTVAGLSILTLEIGLRIALHYAIRRNFALTTPARPLLMPVREIVCFAAWFRSLFGNEVQWGNSSFSIKEYRALLKADPGLSISRREDA